MKIRVGIKAIDKIGKSHQKLNIFSPGGLKIDISGNLGQKDIAANQEISLVGQNSQIKVATTGWAAGLSCQKIILTAAKANLPIIVESLQTNDKARGRITLHGELEITSAKGGLILVLIIDLEDYLKGVLRSEMPASYHEEALKAQAVVARTYGLHPRIDHSADGYLVCNTGLCCQEFLQEATPFPKQLMAVESTKGEVLTYKDKPILALFSANAGGHTEDYANCFSDPLTNKFPDTEIPYLKGVAEGKLPASFPALSGLKELYSMPNVDTADSWYPSFRWQAKFSANALEGQMHNVLKQLQKDKQFAPFIIAPDSGQFGHIEKFEYGERGVSGTLKAITVQTSSGAWQIKKELTIRSLFANATLGVKRLKSARMFFEHSFDNLGLLKEVNIFGLGYGHGVGLQQSGAQGFALKGYSYKQILAHYYASTQISNMS